MTITPCKGESLDTGKLGDLIKDAFSAQVALAKELLDLIGVGARIASSGIGGIKLPKPGSCCDIPPACWMPKELGTVDCQLRPGSTGQVKLVVTNNDFRPHNVTAQSAGANAGLVSFTPPQIALGSKESTAIIAQFTAPKKPGRYEVVVWVTVCSDHYLRWTVEVGEKEKDCCFVVTVDDSPDYEVHWYDHFYCPKPCMGIHGGRNG